MKCCKYTFNFYIYYGLYVEPLLKLSHHTAFDFILLLTGGVLLIAAATFSLASSDSSIIFPHLTPPCGNSFANSSSVSFGHVPSYLCPSVAIVYLFII